MKRLVGGDFLLDLSSITLDENSTLTNITNKEVINQLTNLKKFVSNPSMIKPIWVKLYNGETDELVVTRGSLSVVDSDEFELDVILNGYTLKIHVKFTQMVNEDDDPIDDWYIDTNDAKYLFTTNNSATFKVANVKNIDGEILSQLKCGDVIIKEDASGDHAYIVTFKSETGICLTYTDASVVETQSYDLVDDEWVYNSEDKSDILNPRLETIKDKNGNPRFVEGNISPEEITGFTYAYGKWSLSGTHLMVVIAGEIAEDTVTPVWPNVLANITLPKWIVDKIYPVTNNYLDCKNLVYSSMGSSGTAYLINMAIEVDKTNNKLVVKFDDSSKTMSSTDFGFRFAFDLLIDNE